MNIKFTEKPWGGFKTFVKNKSVTVKILTVEPKQKISLQKHKNRKELWFFLDNSAKVTLGKKTIRFKKGQSLVINRNTIHRVEAYSKQVNILEISFGDFDENDIERFDDIYGRTD